MKASRPPRWFATIAVIAAATELAASATAMAQAAPAAAEAPMQAQVAPAPAAPALAGYLDLRRPEPIHGDAAAGKAKSEVCAACHGTTGTATAPIFPNLAGQRAEYLYWELVEYKRGALPESAMTPLAVSLGEQDMRDLAAYYASQQREPASAEAQAATDPALAEAGRQLFLGGDPAKGIPPCQGCHGPQALGYPLAAQPAGARLSPYALYPALRGQQAAYLQARLTAFQQGTLHDSTNDMIMHGVAQRLDAQTIQSLSAWLSSLPP